jgi:hypothetical protein
MVLYPVLSVVEAEIGAAVEAVAVSPMVATAAIAPKIKRIMFLLRGFACGSQRSFGGAGSIGATLNFKSKPATAVFKTGHEGSKQASTDHPLRHIVVE